MIAITRVTTTETGSERIEPSPRKYQASESMKVEAMETEYVSSSMSTMARTMISVTSVVRKARSLRYPTSTPFTRPTAAPQAIVRTTTSGQGRPPTVRSASATILPSAKVDPTERSMPPATMTIISAITSRENSPHCRSRLAMLDRPKKPGIAEPKAAMTISRISSGIALSIQRFARISPSRWSGMTR